jgi:hypothetical protein
MTDTITALMRRVRDPCRWRTKRDNLVWRLHNASRFTSAQVSRRWSSGFAFRIVRGVQVWGMVHELGPVEFPYNGNPFLWKSLKLLNNSYSVLSLMRP